MYRSHSPRREDLQDGRVFVHGIARMDLSAAHVKAFIDPANAAIMFGFRMLTPEEAAEKGVPIWMATLRKRVGRDAIVEVLQRVYPQLANEDSLVEILADTCGRAKELGYRRLCFSPALYGEPLFPAALKRVADRRGRPVKIRVTTGLTSLVLD